MGATVNAAAAAAAAATAAVARAWPAMSAIEYRKDFAGEQHYASRNHNSFRQIYEAPGGNRSTLDWNLTLRQVRKPRKLERVSASMPHLRTMIRSEGREPQAAEHPDGQYLATSATVGRYQNVGHTAHMVHGASGPHSLDWQLNLRDGMHRSAPSVMNSTATGTNSTRGDENHSSQMTAQKQSRDKDRRSITASVESIRHGSEDAGDVAQWSQWRHLIKDKSHGAMDRAAFRNMTMPRSYTRDTLGGRNNSRSDGDSLGEESRQLRRSRQTRRSVKPEAEGKRG